MLLSSFTLSFRLLESDIKIQEVIKYECQVSLDIRTDVVYTIHFGGFKSLSIYRNFKRKVKEELFYRLFRTRVIPSVINQPNNDSDTSKCTPQCSVDIGAFVCGDTVTGSDLQPAISTQRICIHLHHADYCEVNC